MPAESTHAWLLAKIRDISNSKSAPDHVDREEKRRD
jgi:hypothetical protein